MLLTTSSLFSPLTKMLVHQIELPCLHTWLAPTPCTGFNDFIPVLTQRSCESRADRQLAEHVANPVLRIC